MAEEKKVAQKEEQEFVRGLGLLDSTMIVAGSMIGSGIFIVSADISRLVGSPGWLLLAWVFTGLLTIAAALSYGELAAMMPRAGGQYVYLREAFSPLWGFLYGWTLFLVIQTGTIAAVGVAFAVYLGELFPAVSPSAWIIKPINLSKNYAISLSLQQLIAILLIVLLTVINSLGLKFGKLIQNVFTSAKTLALFALIVICILFGSNSEAISQNFGNFWGPRGSLTTIRPDFDFVPSVAATGGALAFFIVFCVSQVGSLFSSDAWNNITFTAGEVKNPKRNIPLSLAAGTILVISLYILANVAYLMTLPLTSIQNTPSDRVGTAALNAVLGSAGATAMAIAIMVSTFGCNNGLILAGARVYYTMSRDGLFFSSAGKLNKNRVPAVGLILQCVWTCLLVIPRTRSYSDAGTPVVDPTTGFERYGSLYNSLLDYVVFAVLIFYVLTIAGLFVLRRKWPNVERPYKAFGYPIVPILYMIGASAIMAVLLLYRTQTSWPGLLIVLTGIPVYFLWKKMGSPVQRDSAASVAD